MVIRLKYIFFKSAFFVLFVCMSQANAYNNPFYNSEFSSFENECLQDTYDFLREYMIIKNLYTRHIETIGEIEDCYIWKGGKGLLQTADSIYDEFETYAIKKNNFMSEAFYRFAVDPFYFDNTEIPLEQCEGWDGWVMPHDNPDEDKLSVCSPWGCHRRSLEKMENILDKYSFVNEYAKIFQRLEDLNISANDFREVLKILEDKGLFVKSAIPSYPELQRANGFEIFLKELDHRCQQN